MRRRRLAAAAAASLVLAGCGSGSGSDAGGSRPPARVSPVPSGAPVPSPADEVHDRPTVSPTAEAGDEHPLRVGVRVTVSERRVRASRRVVPAFLKLRFRVSNRVGRALRVVVVRSGAGGATVGRATIAAGGTRAIDVEGSKPGSLEVLSPDLDPDNTAIVRVDPGAG